MTDKLSAAQCDALIAQADAVSLPPDYALGKYAVKRTYWLIRAAHDAGIAAERARLLPVLRELIDAGDGIIETIGCEKGDVAYDEASERNHRAWVAARAAVGEDRA